MSPDPQADLARLRAIAMALPRAAEKISHGTQVFYIEKGKTYAWFTHDHHGIGITAVIVKVTGIEEHQLLIEMNPDLYFRPAYFTADSWIGIRTDVPDTDWAHIADRVRESWAMVAPARLRALSGG